VGETFDILLLLALPASGKSEVRRYLDAVEPERRREELHLADPVHLDDYPYVHLMRRISREPEGSGAFFSSDEDSFRDPRDWETLVELLAEDWAALTASPPSPASAASWLLDRLDRARARTGAPTLFGGLDPMARSRLETAISAEAEETSSQLAEGRPVDLASRTAVIEFARGGPAGLEPPLPEPLGYLSSLARLPRALLQRSAVLYVWVTPGQSRARNRERSRPGGEASILHHGVPEAVMHADYGTDDMAWLLRSARVPGTIPIPAAGGCVDVPAVAFDNRDDHTSFLRAEPGDWDPGALEGLHDRLAEALDRLWSTARARR
jgi:hypothetical protein